MALMVDILIQQLRELFETIADLRNGTNTQYSFDDICMSAFFGVFCPVPFLSGPSKNFPSDLEQQRLSIAIWRAVIANRQPHPCSAGSH